jgi:hypothetical protein
VAVEVHQHAADSDGLDFNLALIATNRSVTPRMTIAVNTNGQVSLQWSASPGQAYRVQSTTNLSSTVWTPLGSDVIATGSTASFSDTMTGTGQRFYRVLLIE